MMKTFISMPPQRQTSVVFTPFCRVNLTVKKNGYHFFWSTTTDTKSLTRPIFFEHRAVFMDVNSAFERRIIGGNSEICLKTVIQRRLAIVAHLHSAFSLFQT